jgi:hypothetical protein
MATRLPKVGGCDPNPVTQNALPATHLPPFRS